MAKKKKILYPVLFMIILTAFYTFSLAYVNYSTEEIISNQNQLRIQKSILYVFNIPSENLSDENIRDTFKKNIKILPKNQEKIYIFEKNNNINGYSFFFKGKGLWGTISGHISFNDNFTKILGIDFLSHSETPGLGGRIDELWFKEQFRNINIEKKSLFVDYYPSPDGNVDAITGATLTSKSVKNTLNQSIIKILEYAKEESLYDKRN